MTLKIKSATAQLFLYFVFLAALGSVLLQVPQFYSSGKAVPYIDSLFTTVSAICVTGLSTVDMSVYTNAGFIVILFLIEAGGFGLVAFFTIYLVFSTKKISLLNRNIIRDYFTEDAEVEVRGIIKRIIIATLFVQSLGAIFLSILLKFSGEEQYIFYGFFLSISAFCNAGFAPYSDSLHRFASNYGICIIISMLIVIGGLGFTVITDIGLRIKSFTQKKYKHILSLHSRIVVFMTCFLIIVGAIVIFIFDRNHAFSKMTTAQSILNAFFQSVTLRTAGFDTVSQSDFSVQSSFINLILMFIGGSPGSMAGGLKTTTIFLVMCFAYKNPEDRADPSIFHRDVTYHTFDKAVGVLVKGIFFVSSIFILLLISEKKSLVDGVFSVGDLLYECVSAFGTVGVSKGITSQLCSFSKILLMITMFAGRTGITFIALNAGYKNFKQNSLTDYPHENVLVG